MSDNLDWINDTVRVRIAPALDTSELPLVPVGINGIMFDLPRGVNLEVPRAVAVRLDECWVEHWAMPGEREMQGLEYVGKTPRFAVYPVSERSNEPCVRVQPRAPLSAEQRVRVSQFALQEAAEGRRALAGVEHDASDA